MAKGPGIDNKLSFFKGLLNEFKFQIIFVTVSAGVGAYYLGAWGLLCGVGAGALLKIKSKFKLGEKLRVGVAAPDAPVVTLDGTSASLLSYAKGDRPLVLNFGSFS